MHKSHHRDNFQDALLSINHRISLLQQNLQSKIDRSECMIVCENKATHYQLEAALSSIRRQILEERQQRNEREQRIQEQNQEKLKKLISKFSATSVKKKSNQESSAKHINSPKFMKSQQLYLQSNQTMFNLVIDQINSLKTNYEVIQSKMTKKHQANIALHNEVCQKIEKLEHQVQNYQETNKQIHDEWSEEQREKSTKQFITSKFPNRNISSDKTVNYMREKTPSLAAETPLDPQHNQQLHSFEHIFHCINSIQQQLGKKLNIKDVVPIVQKNIQKFKDNVAGMKQYLQNSMQATKKILVQQSQINEELCSISKVGCWSSFGQETEQGYMKWDKQYANMVPQIFSFIPGEDYIKFQQSGTYIIKIYSLGDERPEYLLVNNNQFDLRSDQLLIKVTEKGSQVRVSSCSAETIMIIHKL